MLVVGDGARDGWRRRASIWVAHRAPWIMSVTAAVVIADELDGVNSFLTLAWYVAMAAGMVTGWISGGHDDVLCEACAAAVPLDPTPVAIRYRWALWVYHRGVKLVTVALGASCAVRVLLPLPWGAVFSYAVACGVLIVVFRAGLKHRPLVRGCPECHDWRGDDGNGRAVSTPDPQPVGQKTR